MSSHIECKHISSVGGKRSFIVDNISLAFWVTAARTTPQVVATTIRSDRFSSIGSFPIGSFLIVWVCSGRVPPNQGLVRSNFCTLFIGVWAAEIPVEIPVAPLHNVLFGQYDSPVYKN